MNKTKKSLFMSAISLLLCISMLIGSTFAWFTDSVSSGSNVIVSGNLDLDVQYTLDGKTWKDLDGANDLFQKGLWEPGHTEVVALKITNNGSLAMKYAASMNIVKETIGKNKAGGNIVLSEILTVSTLTFAEAGVDPVFGLNIAERSIEEAFKGENNLAYNAPVAFKSGNVLQGDKQLLPGDAHYVVVKVDMPETVGNEANHDGVNVPKIEFGINVLATQSSYESDSFGDQYDKDATFDDFANTNILATATKTLAAGANSLDFDLSYNGLKIAKVIVPAGAIANTAEPVTVTFDGINPSQAAIIDDNTKAYAYDIDVTNLKDNLSGDQLITVVVTAPNALAAMKAYHNGTLIQDAVYDEVEGTITFKTASFSPYDFTYQEMQAATLEELRAAVKESNVEIKLTEDLEINLEAGSKDRSEDHKAKSTDGKTMWYNAVNIVGENVAIDLNGHKITVKCSNAHDGNQDVGALFFVDKEGSLNIIDRKGGGFIKMESSIYAVWAPFADPSYVDIYSGAFIGDSYAGDPIGTPVDSNGNYDPANGTMKNENSNRALIYAGFGGNMNVYGGYFLYNNTPNDTKDRNNGAFNAKDFYEGNTPLLTIHAGVKLINKEYRQNPANTSQPHGSYDNYSVKLAKDCEIALIESTGAVLIDGYAYSSWYTVIQGVNSISANAKENVYTVGYEFTTDDFQVFAFSVNGQSGTIENFEISDVDTSTPGAKLVTITYTKDDSVLTAQCAVQVMNLGDTDNTIKTPNGNNPLYQQYFNAGNFNVSGWANIDGDINGNKIAEPSYANMIGKTFEGKNGEIVTGFNLDLVNGQYGENYYDLTIKNAKQFTTLGINCLVAYDDPNNPIKGFGCYINNDKSTLTWNSPAIVYIGSGQAEGTLPGTTYQVNDDVYNTWGANNAYALTTTTCANFQAGKTYTVHWVVVFEDGLSELCEWSVTMADITESDAMFTDTEKPNANVIIMAGQSNMFGASPLTQTIIEQYAGYDFSNVFIKYNNINFDVVNGVTQNTLSTVFSNNGFEKYKLGIGGQSDNYFGPETALAAILSTTEGLKDQKWFIIKYAPAGTALSSQWTAGCQVNGKNTNLTDDMLEYVQTAIDELSGQYDVQVQSFMWMQGESDAINKTTAEGYAALEQNLVERVRNRFAAYATRKVGSIPGSGISFVNAGIADNDTDYGYTDSFGPNGEKGPNNWIYAEIVNAGKISNSQWLCSIVGAGTDAALTTGPLAGYTFGKDKPTIPNPKQDGTIVNSIYIDTHHLLSKLNSTTEHPEYLEGDKTDWAHYGADSMDELGSLFASCLHYLMITDAGPVQQRVTFSADGGTVEGGNTQYAYVGEKITLPAATRDGYTFIGWYTQSTGGELIGNAGDEYVANGSLTMYAQWTEVPKVQYTVTYNANSGSVSPSSATVNAGESVTLPTPTRNSYTFSGWYTAASGGNKVGDAGASYTPTANITLYAQWTAESGENPCVTPDTLVTLADGSQKRIDEVTYDDMLLVWNNFTGKYDVAPAAIIFNHGYDNNTIIKLSFSDGTVVKVANLHQFYDTGLNKYVSIDAESVAQYIGHTFAKQSGDGFTTVTLESYDVSVEYEAAYGIISAFHYNIIVEGMISTDFMLEDYDLFNYFEYGENMTFDEAKMQADIEKYGLYTYEDFADYLTYEQFVGFNVQYFKIAVGKGNYTYEGILALISTYLSK